MPLIVSRGALSARAFGFGGAAKSVAWGTPTSLGTASNNTGTTLVLTGCTVPAGALIVVCVLESTTTIAGTVADSASNSYALASSKVISATSPIMAFYAYNVSALSSQSITYNKRASLDDVVMSAFYITGELTSSTPLDLVTTPTTGTSTTPSITSASPAAANELFVGVVGWNTSTGTLTQPVSPAFATPPVLESLNSETIGGGVFVNTGSGAITYAPTISTSQAWAALLISFKHS